ncbi:MAG: hypothetical protein OXG08_09305 [Gammaproteobacteria bacterium]|nr:hypothetical protein [Gammaproteobacteria bacterium]
MIVSEIRRGIRTVTDMVRLDARHLYRRATNPLLLASLVLVLLTVVLTHGAFFYVASPYATFQGASNPRYGLGGYEPLLFYLCIVVALVFALRLPSYRENSVQNVVVSYRPPSNFQLALARVLSSTLLVSGVVIVAALIYQAIASLDVSIHPGFMEPFETHSLIFVSTNLVLCLLFWTSLATLIAQVYKSATAGFIGTLAILTIQAYMSPLLPAELGSFTFGYNAASLYVSELAPDYWELRHFCYFVSLPCLALALILTSSLFFDRTDVAKKTVYLPLFIALTSIGVVFQTTVHALTLVELGHNQSSIQAYDSAARSLQQLAHVEAISGSVKIDPGSRLHLHLSYKIHVDQVAETNSEGSADLSLSFALNPGMKIIQVLCSDSVPIHSHTNGILTIDIDPCIPTAESAYIIHLIADGRPDPHYLVNHIPQSGLFDIDPHLVRLMGQRSSIFTTQYVALTPLSHWYPRLLESGSNRDGTSSSHLSDVSIEIEINPNTWTIAASGGNVFAPQDGSDDPVVLEGRFQSLGLLAAEFHVDRYSLESINVDVLVHTRHAKRLDRNKIFMVGLANSVNNAIARLNAHGIDYPHERYSVVEVPSTLSLLDYGFGVNNGMGSIMMFRESGIPFVRARMLEDRGKRSGSNDSEPEDMQVNFASTYYRNYWKNQLFNATYHDVIVSAMLTGRFNLGEQQSEIAGIVMEMLLLNTSNYRFDFDLANSFAPDAKVNIRYLWRQRRMISQRDLAGFQEDFLNSSSYWEMIERPFGKHGMQETEDRASDSRLLRRSKRFRMLKLAELIDDSIDEEAQATIVAKLLNGEAQQKLNLNEIYDAARASNLSLESFVQSTLLTEKLPGINFSVPVQVELSETNEHGHRFNTVLNLRNSEDVTGYVRFDINQFQEMVVPVLIEESSKWVEVNRPRRFLAGTTKLGPFEVKANSSYRLVANTETKIWPFRVYTYLSRNRGSVTLSVASTSSARSAVALEGTTSNWYSFSPSQWNSEEDDLQIIVDDLDPGFEVPASNYRKALIDWTFGIDWFRIPYLKEVGVDNGLPIDENPIGPWVRSSNLGGWGRYRHTYALANTESPGNHEVSFNTELARAGNWTLSYHLPDFIYTLNWDGEQTLGNYNIAVTVGNQEWELMGDEDKWGVGWNAVSSLDIAKPGKARVSVSNKCDCPFVFADAIKWTFTD